MAEPVCQQKLPLAVESFEHLRATDQYYVDKTLFIRDVIRQAGDPLLFTRPRRFGKTLAMSTLRTFFEKTDRDTSIYFIGTNIERAGAEILAHQGKYPVIHLSFKDAVGDSAQSILDDIREEIISEYRRHRNATKDAGLDQDISEEMRRFIFEEVSESKLVRGIRSLSSFLHEFYGVKPVVLIDEYDAPIRRAWALRHREPAAYDTVVSFMRRLLSSTLKTNFDISYSCLTGIERVAKAAGESGINNLRVFGVLDEPFAEYFGFSHDEVKLMLEAYGVSEHYDEICDWYQGYRFGGVEMFNPLSVMNYIEQGCKARAYWPLTSHNATIGDAIDYATSEVLSDLSKLAAGSSVQAEVRDTLVYPDLPTEPAAVFTLLLGAGYLTSAKDQLPSSSASQDVQTLVIPNEELREMYRQVVFNKAAKASSGELRAEYAAIRDALLSGDPERFQENLRKLLLKLLGPNDIGGKRKEDAYHLLLVGLLGPIMGSYMLASNGNAGDGRFDISLTPMMRGDPAVIIEVKAESRATEKKLKDLAEKALEQIDKKNYIAQAGWAHVGKIYKYGVAFSLKHVQVAWAAQ